MTSIARLVLIAMVSFASFASTGAPAAGQSARTPARTPRRAGPASTPGADALARGWTALAAGRAPDALAIARDLLAKTPRDHNAAALAVTALGEARQPLEALDLYERWLTDSGHEDVFLLQPVAIAMLRQIAEGADPRARLAALAVLAATGDAAARASLDDATAEQGAPIDIEASLAAAGDPAAINRLQAQVEGTTRDKSAAIDALGRAGARGSAPALISALDDPAPPTRIAAANALAELGATEAVGPLERRLTDPDPAVRQMAAVALARLGEPTGEVTLESMATSPIAEFRLQAAAAAAAQDTTGQGDWPDRVRPLLTDPDPQVRLQAARLLLDRGREVEAARLAVSTALQDPSPAARTAAAELIGQAAGGQAAAGDPATLRRLLRDAVADVRIAACRALLASPR